MTPKELGRVGDPDFVLEGHASDLAEVRRLVTGDNLAECLVEELCGIVFVGRARLHQFYAEIIDCRERGHHDMVECSSLNPPCRHYPRFASTARSARPM